MRDWSSRLAIVVLSGSAVLLGCYQYVPGSLDTVPIGARVRAQLSSEAELLLRDSLRIDARVVNGTLVDREQQRLLLQVRAASGARTFGDQSLYQRIAVTPQDVLRLEIRKVNGVKTGALAVALAGMAALLIIEITGHNRPGTPEPPPGPPPEQWRAW